MCQLNLYMVPNNVSRENVIRIFEKYNFDICEESYYKPNDMAKGYEVYSNSYKCDCKSIISRLQEGKVNSFDDYKVKKKREDIEKLNRIKTLKETKDYETKAKKFENHAGKLLEEMNNLEQNIYEYKTEETEKILALNLQDEERDKLFNEVLYPKIAEMKKELENRFKEFGDYEAENEDISESLGCNIEEFERTVAEYDFSDFYEQFNVLKNVYTEILKLADEICIYPFLQDGEILDCEDGEILEIEAKRQVMIQNLNIDDLVFFPYRSLLKISSVKD